MPKEIDLEEILSQNPQIDPDKLADSREMLRKLRERGVRRKDYDLAPPFGGRRAIIQDKVRTASHLTKAGRES